MGLLVGCDAPDAAVPLPDASPSPDAYEPTPPAGIVAWLSFDPSNDPVRNRYQLAFGGFFGTAYGPGYRGKGITMDGYLQYGFVQDEKAMQFQGAFTMAAWVRADRVPADIEFIVSRSYGNADELSMALFVDSSMHLRFVSQGGASLVSTTALTVGEWTHVALSFDGTNKRVFINDTLAGTEASPPFVWDDHPLFFGADEGASVTAAKNYLFGVIDEVMFFDRALDASELAGL